MRPFITFPSDTLAAVNYGFDRAEDVVGGTIPCLTPEKIAAVLDASAPKGVRMSTSVLHITLSAPHGITLPRDVWQSVIKHVLMRLRIDPETHAWIAFRHSDKNCEHVHVPVSRTDLFGRPSGTLPRDLDTLCSEIHRDLALRLGFEIPDYPVLSPHPRLHSRAPKRRAEKPLVASLHDEVGRIFVERRPVTVDDLAAYIPEPFALDRDAKHPAFLIRGRRVTLANLKPDLTSQAILDRLSHVAAIRRALGLLREMSFIQRFLNPASRARLIKLTKDLQHDEPNPLRIAATTASPLRPERRDLAQTGRDETASGPVGGVEGPRDGSSAPGSRRGSGSNPHHDEQYPSPAVSDGSTVAGREHDACRAETVPRPDCAPPSLTVGTWVADLWGAALRLARRPTIVFGRKPGRATVRFADTSRIEVVGAEVTLGHVGSGDLATPRKFATALSEIDPAWIVDAALSDKPRQTRKPRSHRPVFILANLEAATLRRARRALGLSFADASPLFLAADDPATRNFPDAPLLPTDPRENEWLEKLQGKRRLLAFPDAPHQTAGQGMPVDPNGPIGPETAVETVADADVAEPDPF